MGGITRREVTVGGPTCLLGFSGRDKVDSGVFDTTTLSPGGVDEVQTVTITGSPGGGTFKLGYAEYTRDGHSPLIQKVTAAIAYNAAAATVQTALRALSNLGAGVSVTGSAGGPYTVTFTGSKVGGRDLPLLVLADNSLTGGTTPSVTIAEATKGSSLHRGLFVLVGGLVLMSQTGNKKVKEYDGSGAANIIGIFDGRREFLANDGSDDTAIPIYNFQCAFDKAQIKNYATYAADLATWGAAHACVFQSQGT